MRRLAIAPLALVVLLSGCATLTEQECLTGNWQEIGQRDGQNGRTADYLARHVKACEKSGVVPDRQAWERGRQSGLAAYCTPSKVYQEGRSGRGLSPVCPASSLGVLQAANQKGLEYHRLGSEMSDLRREITLVEDALADEDDSDRRAALLLRLRNLNDRLSLLRLRQQMVASL